MPEAPSALAHAPDLALLPVAAWVTDLDGRVLGGNAAAAELGVFAGESSDREPDFGVLGARYEDPGPLSKARAALREVARGGPPASAVRWSARRPTGGSIALVASARAVLGAEGHALGAFVCAVALPPEDVSGLERAEQELREREAELRHVLDSIPQLAWIAAPDATFLWGNARWREYHGATPEEMDAEAVVGRLHPSEVERVGDGIRRALASGASWEDTFRIRSAAGEWRWFLSRAVPLKSPDGRVMRWFGTNTDVTAHVEAQADLAFRARVSSLLAAGADGEALVDQVTTALAEHLQVERCWGGAIDLEADVSDGWVQTSRGVPPLAATGIPSRHGPWLLGELAAGRHVVVVDIARDAGIVDAADSFEEVGLRAFVAVPWVDRAGPRLVGAFGVGSAVPREWTPREIELVRFTGERVWAALENHRLFAKLTAAEEHFRTLAESAPSMVWRVEVDRGCTYMSSLWVERTGVPVERLLGWGFLDTLHAEDRAQLVDALPQLRDRAEPFSAEYRIRMADGSYTWHLSRGRPIADGAGRVVQWVGTTMDIDAQRRAAEALQTALNLRDEFLSVASHELATPLTSLQLQVQGLRHALGTRGLAALSEERVARMLAVTDRQIRHLTHLVGDLLDVTRLDHGRPRLQRSTFDLVHVVRDVADGELEHLRLAGCALVLLLPERAVGTWDRDRLRQVLVNLLANAAKYGPGAPVVVRLDLAGDRVTLTVTDHGVGVAPEDRERIFDRFERGTRTLHTGGLGLGLYVCREALLAHGGAIRVESAPGPGSSFVVELPRRGAGAPSSRAGA